MHYFKWKKTFNITKGTTSWSAFGLNEPTLAELSAYTLDKSTVPQGILKEQFRLKFYNSLWNCEFV